MPKFASPEEIIHAHSVLLSGKPEFEQDKIDIIECNESKDIKACPGSGKTTTLLAKLVILANKMPLPNNQGICVLTHTNVAIDEIKHRLGHKADILFKYPNHFGTIQSFVDKFLAIPYFSNKFHKKPSQISNDAYIKNLERSFKAKLSHIKDNEQALYKRMWHYFHSNKELFNNIRLTIIDSKYQLIDIKSNSIVNFKKPQKGKSYIDWTENEKEKMRKMTIKIILNVFDYYSSISYQDAYTLSLVYGIKKPEIKDAISCRFKYLFIDEMQDTDKYQSDILDLVFDSNKTIIQRFGDHHQAIYSNIKSDEVWIPVNCLPINNSKRFGEHIAKVLRSTCCERNNILISNSTINSLPPSIIVFKDPTKVLPKFCELLKTKRIDSETIWEKAIEEKINTNKLHNIKAIGWVGNVDIKTRSKKNLSIKSYFPTFNNNTKKKEKVNYDSLKSFLRKQENSKVKDYADKIIEALLHVLSTTNKKYRKGKIARNYTKTTLLESLAEKSPETFEQFKSNTAKWSKMIHCSEAFSDEAINEIKEFITSIFCPLYEIDATLQYIAVFLNNALTGEVAEEIKNNNVFRMEDVEVEIATIHSVKGETHIATLYMETSYYSKHESERIMEQLKGEYYTASSTGGTHKKEALKMAYVGMSRPQYFLCMAIHKDRFDDSLNIENGGMWEIINA